MLRRALVALVLLAVVTGWSYGTIGLQQALIEHGLASPGVKIVIPEPETLDDEAGDTYHPAGDPGIEHTGVDLRSIRMMAWAFDTALILEGKNPFEASLTAEDGIRRGGPKDLAFDVGAPYAVFEFDLAGDVTYQDFFCEYPVAWRDPMYPAFEGIEGDLFDGANHVNVVRTGEGVPGGFEVAGVEYMDGAWMPAAPFGFGAADGDRVVHAIPSDVFGISLPNPFVSPLRQGTGEPQTEFDFNFGAFCSEGGQSFDPGLGAVDILQAPVELADLPSVLVSADEPVVEETTTTAAPPAVSSQTTTATTPPTSVVAGDEPGEEGAGLSPALLAAIAAAVAGVGYAAWRAARDAAEKAASGLRYRLEVDGIPPAGFAAASGLEIEQGDIEYRTGSEDHITRKQPGLTKFTNIRLERGVVEGEAASDFQRWLMQGGDADPASGRIVLLGETGGGVEWRFDRAWPTKFTGPGLNAANNEVAVETLELTLEGLEVRATGR